MAANDKYYPGSTVSRHLPAGDRSWSEAVYQSGKPVLDAELNLNQEIGDEIRKLLWHEATPSGWVRGTAAESGGGFTFPLPTDPLFVANSFLMAKQTAIVAGNPVVIEYSNIDTALFNRIQLSTAPVVGGAPPDVKRTDFVFLEVWKALVSESPNATATITITGNPAGAGDNFDFGGNTLTGVLAAPGVDEYLVGGSDAITAANIASAINNSPPNSFTNITASASGPVITIRAVASGTAGNGITVGLAAAGGGGTYVFSGPATAGGVDAPNKPTQDSIYIHGNVDSSSAVALPDDIEDPIVATETTKRVQVQYRLRVTGQTEAVNYKTELDGFSNVNVTAQGSQVAPVGGYPFVRADSTTSSGGSDATAYGVTDNGLWIAGDGSSASATALGTVDGFVYAIPVCFVFRRNNASGTTGWDPLTNTNGGLSATHAGFPHPILGPIPAGDSDRPDGLFYDAIVGTDVLDLRRHVIPGGLDWSTELNRQMQYLLDGNLGTWAVDTSDKQDLGAGSGDVSYRYLICNEVGRSNAEGGIPPGSGDTTRGVSVANFDHVRRRFGDQAVVERVVFPILPTDTAGAEPGKYNVQANPGHNGWAEGDEINIDLGALNATGTGEWSDGTKSFTGGVGGGHVSGLWPPGTTITDVLLVRHDDGHHTNPVSQDVQFTLVSGIGTDHLRMVLDANPDLVNGGDNGNPDNRMVGDVLDDGSQRRIFVEVEVTYPIGSGTTDTVDYEVVPDAAVYPVGPALENDQTQRPTDFEGLMPVRFREGKREVHLEYVANDTAPSTPISDTFVSADPATIFPVRRLYGSGTTVVGVTDISTAGAGAPHDVDQTATEYGSSSRKLALDTSGPAPKIPLSGAGQTLVSITYYAQDAIPNYGAGAGYQIAVYFRSTAPQTSGVKSGGLALPDPFTVRPLVMSRDLWTGTVGPGSVDLPFPYTVPMDHIPVNGDIPSANFPGEWYFASTASISVDDFSAGTGLLNLHGMVPADGTGTFTLSQADTDIEFRSHYKVSDVNAYRPTMFSQPLSSAQRHKVWFPFLAVSTADYSGWRKGEVLLLVVTRFAELDDENTVRFTDTGNTTCVAVYRTKGLLMVTGG